MESAREHVQQEAAHELLGAKCHGLVTRASLGAIVFPAEDDAALIEGDEPPVGDGYSVGVARQISQDGLWPGEGALGVDHPFGFAQRYQPLRERWRVLRIGVFAKEA